VQADKDMQQDLDTYQTIKTLKLTDSETEPLVQFYITTPSQQPVKVFVSSIEDVEVLARSFVTQYLPKTQHNYRMVQSISFMIRARMKLEMPLAEVILPGIEARSVSELNVTQQRDEIAEVSQR
jgi:hypothetical protein